MAFPGDLITIIDALKVIVEDPGTSGKTAHTTISAILTYFNSTKGYKTITEIQTYLDSNSYTDQTDVVDLLDLNNYLTSDDLSTGEVFTSAGATALNTLVAKRPDNLVTGFSLTYASGPKITIGSGVYGDNIITGISKGIAATWAEGDNSNGMGAVLDGLLGIFLIQEDADLTNYDFYFDSLDQSNTPAGWSVLLKLGEFWHTSTSLDTDIVQLSLSHYNDISLSQNAATYPSDYISDFELSFTANGSGDNDITLTPNNDAFFCLADNSTAKNNSVIRAYESLTGEDLGGTADTTYYIYITTDSNGESHTIESGSDAVGTGLTGSNYRLIGFYKTDGSGDVFMTWTINQKWDDKNFDVSANAKDNSILTSAPDYEALFSGDSNTIKVATFDSDGAQDHFIDTGCAYPHDGKNDHPINFHFHAYAEDANSGNVVMFLDYIFTNDAGTEVIAAPTRLTKTFAVSGTKGEHQNIEFDWIIPTSEQLIEGTQMWFTFGRLSTDANDTYASKIAVRTFGFYYLRNKKGSDLILDNI